MTPAAVFVVGVVVTSLCIAFLWGSLHEMRRLGHQPEDRADVNPHHL
jgi:hypothetical protein